MKKLLNHILLLSLCLTILSCGDDDDDDDNNNGGSRLPSAIKDINGDRYMSAVLAEFDGNPGVDLMLGGVDRSGIERDVLLFNDGSGNFELAPAENVPDRFGDAQYGTVQLRADDFDNDGDNDVIAGVHGPLPSEDATIMLYLNDGSGVFRDASDQVAFDTTPNGLDGLIIGNIELADVDQDGDTDLIVIAGGTDNAIYLNDGSANFTKANFTGLDFGFAFHASGGDANGDNIIDIVAPSALYQNDGSNNYSSQFVNTSEFLEPMFGTVLRNAGGGNPLVIGVQFVFLDMAGASIKVFQLNDADEFADVTDDVLGIDKNTIHPRNLYVADFDGNGTDDLFIADHGFDNFPFPGAQNTLLLQQTDGTLIDASDRLPQVSDFTHDAAIGDIDRDGDIDIYASNLPVGDGASQVPYFMINDGAGNFTLEN